MKDNSLWQHISIGVCNALIAKKSVLDDLINLYKQDPCKFYSAAKSTSIYSCSFFTYASLDREVNLRRVFGIVTVAEEDSEVRGDIIRILSKHYLSWYNLINNKKPINISNEVGYGIDLIEENVRLLIPYYLIRLIYGTTDIPEYSNLINDVESSLSLSLEEGMEDRAFIESRKEEFRPFLKKCKRLFSTIKSCDDMFQLYYSSYTGAKIPNDIISVMALNMSQFVHNLFCGINLNAPLLTSGVEIERELQEFIFTQITLIVKDNDAALHIPEEDIAVFYFLGITIISLLKEYNKAKEFYNENNQENVFMNFEIAMREYKKIKVEHQDLVVENKRLHSKCEELASLIATTTKEKDKIYSNTIREQEKEIAKLRQLLDIETEKNIELNALREFVFSSKSDNCSIPSEDFRIDSIHNKKIIVIGGPDNWQKKVKGVFPEYNIISGFNVKFDLNALKSADYVFLNVIDMSHSAYLRIIDFIRKHNIRYWYINSTNMDNLYKEIVTKINDKYK